MESSNNGKYSGFFSKKLKAGKRRTYFFDVRSTKQGDYFLTITESKKKFEGDGYESHKIFLYKEDFKKFLEALNETVSYVKTELMPDFDYDTDRSTRLNSNENSEISENVLPVAGADKRPPVKKVSEVENTDSVKPTSTPHITDDEQVDWN
ncbi:MAG: DUF3276 family protein [Chitinophagales bacterium]